MMPKKIHILTRYVEILDAETQLTRALICINPHEKSTEYTDLSQVWHDAFSFEDKLSKYHPISYLIACFHGIKGFPKSNFSACKRLNMLLRWMSRKNSPVDLGLWDIKPSKLIIPLDTHVHRIALDLGLTKRKQADMKTALEITDAMREIWPEDPAKGDFALFGYGVNNK